MSVSGSSCRCLEKLQGVKGRKLAGAVGGAHSRLGVVKAGWTSSAGSLVFGTREQCIRRGPLHPKSQQGPQNSQLALIFVSGNSQTYPRSFLAF